MRKIDLRALLRATATVLTLTFCLPASGAVITPTYQVTGSDAVWTHTGGGVYTVSTSAEDWVNEIWERPVEDSKWSDGGGTRTSSGKYYGYADLVSASWGVGSDNMGNDYLFSRWEVAGGFFHDAGSSPDFGAGFLGHYYFYYEPAGELGQVIEISGGDADGVGTSFGTAGKVKFYTEGTEGDVPGTGITVTGEGGPSYGGSTVSGEIRRNGAVVETAVLLSDLGLTISDFNNLDYAYAGVAVSNPSSPNTDLFANDFYTNAQGFGVEYDTIRLGTSAAAIPEPSSFALLTMIACGCIGFYHYRRVKTELPEEQC